MRGAQGPRLGSGIGSSLDFHDYRDYQPGDDLRRLDWSVFARSDKCVVKLFREEVFPVVDIILDTSRSMNLADTKKCETAVFSAGVMTAAALNAGCKVTLWATNGRLESVSGDDISSPHSWPIPDFTSSSSPQESISLAPVAFPRNGIRVFISDLLWQGTPEATLGRLVAGASALFIVQVLAEDDINPSATGNSRLIDSETGEKIEAFIDGPRLDAYRKAFGTHCGYWRDACRAAGAEMVMVSDGLFSDFSALISKFERAAILEVV